MFKLESIKFIHNEEIQEYKFTEHSFIFGKNTRGKTALTVAIDYILGSGEKLTYQGLDHIDSIEAHLTNELTNLWIKRDIEGGCFYRRTEESDFTQVSLNIYKDNICLMLMPDLNNRYLDIYTKVFDERPTFRSFNFLNYIDEKGAGDLSVVFTKAKDLKHNIRVRNIMNFFFNFEKIEQIYEKEVLLEQRSSELEKISMDYQEYHRIRIQQQKIFKELQLPYTGKYSKDYKCFCDFKNTYTREAKQKEKDLVYLSQASFSLSEEIKLYQFMKNQSINMVKRKERIKRLLTILDAVVNDAPEYLGYTKFIKETVERIDDENVILSLTDYTMVIKNIKKEKNRLDAEIALLKGKSSEISYEEAMKKVGLLEHLFDVLQENVDEGKVESLKKEVDGLKKEIKELKLSFDHNKIHSFNERLTELYLREDLAIKHLEEDLKEECFSLEYDPFRVCLYAKHMEGDYIVKFMPGSMARQTHIQILIYLTMFEYLKEKFPDFIIMPLLVIDSANQSMETDCFQKVYPVFMEMAETIGIQTIFLSKEKIEGIRSEDFIDISDGLNRFHQN